MIISTSLKMEKNNRLKSFDKKFDKKEPPKKPTKDDLREFNEQVNKRETGINSELFRKHFNFQRPSDVLYIVIYYICIYK